MQGENEGERRIRYHAHSDYHYSREHADLLRRNNTREYRLNHPNRCQANFKSGRVCYAWAMIGSKYCRFHAGRQSRNKDKRKILAKRAKDVGRIDTLPHFYSGVLSGTLKEFVENHLEQTAQDQLNLFAELALVRSTAMEIVKMYDMAVNSGNQEIICSAGALLRDVLKDVERVAISASNIEAKHKGLVSAHSIQATVNQLVRIAYDVLDQPTAKDFEQAARERIRLIEHEDANKLALGTNLTPDAIDNTVLEMDSTIPYEPEPEQQQ